MNNYDLILCGCVFNIDLTENQISLRWGVQSNPIQSFGSSHYSLKWNAKCCFRSAVILKPHCGRLGRLSKWRPPLYPPPMAGPYYNPRPRQRIPRDLAMCVTPSGQFYCSMCNCGAEQETDFRQHLESKQHKAKVSELRYRHEMENLGYS